MNFVESVGPAYDWQEVDDEHISDDELTALALAADTEQELDPDAVALPLYPDQPSGALPLFYMPPAMARAGDGGCRLRSASCWHSFSSTRSASA